MTTTAQLLADIATYLADSHREAIHAANAPCTPEEYVVAYYSAYGDDELFEAAEQVGTNALAWVHCVLEADQPRPAIDWIATTCDSYDELLREVDLDFGVSDEHVANRVSAHALEEHGCTLTGVIAAVEQLREEATGLSAKVWDTVSDERITAAELIRLELKHEALEGGRTADQIADDYRAMMGATSASWVFSPDADNELLNALGGWGAVAEGVLVVAAEARVAVQDDGATLAWAREYGELDLAGAGSLLDLDAAELLSALHANA